jgi:hypothetical protein
VAGGVVLLVDRDERQRAFGGHAGDLEELVVVRLLIEADVGLATEQAAAAGVEGGKPVPVGLGRVGTRPAVRPYRDVRPIGERPGQVTGHEVHQKAYGVRSDLYRALQLIGEVRLDVAHAWVATQSLDGRVGNLGRESLEGMAVDVAEPEPVGLSEPCGEPGRVGDVVIEEDQILSRNDPRSLLRLPGAAARGLRDRRRHGGVLTARGERAGHGERHGAPGGAAAHTVRLRGHVSIQGTHSSQALGEGDPPIARGR